MRRVLTYEMNESRQESIADFLKARGFSRHILTHLKRTQDGICVNGTQAGLYQTLEAGERLTITIEEDASSENIIPKEVAFTVVYEDEDILVVDKPADTPIHPSIHNYENTLANGIADYYKKQGKSFVYRCVNRLDRDTTGLLVIAKNMLSAAILSDMVKKREIQREYLAIVSGKTPDEGTVDAPIGRKADSVLERCVDFEHGERAVTRFRRLDYRDGYSLVLLKLETGRTHQIRVHMKYLGYPVIGDFLYNPDYRRMTHQALHSYRLKFCHPITGKALEFSALPPWKW